jgi:uncharacterized membrane protein YfcA
MQPWQYAIIGLAVIVLGISKTGFGGGIGILVIPIIGLAMSAADMLGVVAILLIAVDVFANLHYLDAYDKPALKWLIPGAVIGVIVGYVVLHIMSTWTTDKASFDRTLSLTIGGICLAVIAVQSLRLAGVPMHAFAHGPAGGVAVGAVAGSVSTVSHTAGPIVTLYLLDDRVEKRKLVGTMLLYTLVINCVKLPAYIALGVVSWTTLTQTLWMIPLLPIGTIIGAWMNKRIPEKPFVILTYLAAAVAAGQMVWKALR